MLKTAYSESVDGVESQTDDSVPILGWIQGERLLQDRFHSKCVAYKAKPHHAGIGIGGIGVAFSLLVTTLVFLIPHHLLSTAAAQEYLDTWMNPILSVAMPMEQFGIPLLAAIVAFYLVWKREYSTRDVVVEFVLGSLVLGIGVALLNWAVTHPSYRATTLTYSFDALRRAGYFAGAAFLGTVSGEVTVREHNCSDSS